MDLVLGLAAAGLLCLGTASAADLYVAPDGDDAGAGTPTVPFATLGRAIEASRALGTDEARRIVVRGGKYYEVSVSLGSQDSGLIIEAAPGDTPVLYGGRLVTGWEKDGENFVSADVPGVRDRSWDFRMLCVNGRFCPRARLPREGVFEHLTEFKVPWMGTTGGGWQRKPTQEELTTMQYKPEDLGPWLDINNAELTIYHSWDESVVGLASLDPETHTLRLAQPCGHPPGGFGIRRYVVWNVREGMTQPGQWYLDRTREKIVYWPLPGEDLTTAEVVAPTAEKIISIRGTEAAPVRDVTLRGLCLSVTTTPLRAGGFGASAFQGAVSLAYAEGCLVEGLRVVNVGGQGVTAWRFTGLRIERCEVASTGACGIKATDGDCTIADNYVHHVGLTYPSAIALWGGGEGGPGSLITHNEIHDVPYTGIACGGDNHVIEANLIYRCMQVMHDGGGIYITFGKGMTCRGNFVHDVVFDGGNTANAYYLDEQAEGCLVEGNLSLRCGSPLLSHWNTNNTLRANVFVHDGDVLIRFPRSSGWCVEGNVLAAEGKVTLRDTQAVTQFRSNVLFSRQGKIEEAVRGEDGKWVTRDFLPPEGSLVADPLLVEYERGVVRFAADSPALGLGIQPMDVSGAGRR